MEQNKREHIRVLFLLLTSFAMVAWTIGINGLLYGDYTYLARARFDSYENLLAILPAGSYNDHSVGLVFLKLLNQVFGDSYGSYHIVAVLLHLWNVYLVYRVVDMGLERFRLKNEQYAFMAAAIFGVYPGGLFSVQWISAICNIQCCNFALLSIWGYLKSREEKEQYTGFFAVFSFFTYWISLRCSELALTIPVILLIYEVAVFLKKKKKAKQYKTLIAMLLFMVAYAALLYVKGSTASGFGDSYYTSLSPIVAIKNLFVYLAMYFDVMDAQMFYSEMKDGHVIALGFFGAVFIFSIADAIMRKKAYTLLVFVMVVCSLGMALPLENTSQQMSNLYLPAVFISMYLALLIKNYAERLKIENMTYICATVLVGCGILYWAPGNVALREQWLETAAKDKDIRASIVKLDGVRSYTTFYVEDGTEGYDAFSFGPGHILNLLYDDYTIDCQMVEGLPENPAIPYVYARFQDGVLQEIERNELYWSKLQIEKLTKEVIDSKAGADAFNVGVIYEQPYNTVLCKGLVFDDMQVRINGEEIPSIRGEDFVSFAIPEELRKPGTTIEVSLYSATAGGESTRKTIEIK